MARVLLVPSKAVQAAVPFPEWIDALSLAANVAKSYTVPATVDYLVITATAGFYMNTNGAASVPGDTTDGTASGYVPSTVNVRVGAGDSISFLSTTNCVITLWGYKA